MRAAPVTGSSSWPRTTDCCLYASPHPIASAPAHKRMQLAPRDEQHVLERVGSYSSSELSDSRSMRRRGIPSPSPVHAIETFIFAWKSAASTSQPPCACPAKATHARSHAGDGSAARTTHITSSRQRKEIAGGGALSQSSATLQTRQSHGDGIGRRRKRVASRSLTSTCCAADPAADRCCSSAIP